MILSTTAIVLIVLGGVIFSAGIGLFICYYHMDLKNKAKKSRRTLSGLGKRGFYGRRLRPSAAEMGQIPTLTSANGHTVTDGRRLSASEISYDIFQAKGRHIPTEVFSPTSQNLKPLRRMSRHATRDVRDSPILEDCEDEGNSNINSTQAPEEIDSVVDGRRMKYLSETTEEVPVGGQTETSKTDNEQLQG